MKILVLGIGNELMRDDGVGIRVIRMLNDRYRFDQDVTLLEGGTLGLDLLPQLQETQRLLVVDAMDADELPGTLLRIAGDDISTAGTPLSPHQLGLKELLAVASLLGEAPEETVIWGVQLGNIELGMELSPAVEAQLEPLMGALLRELTSWGVEARFSQEVHSSTSSG